jgi:methylated-DNA-[protein]-cysteine S-methyltransferase
VQLTREFFHVLEASPFGRFAVVWAEEIGGPLIRRVFLSSGEIGAEEHVSARFPASRAGRSAAVEELAADIRRFLEGEDVPMPLEHVDLEACSSFQRAVLLTECEIPRGRVSTYGGIAQHVGVPGGARAVGRALSTNPFPVIIPCHRAVCAGGRLGGYQGGVAMKRALLEYEGASFSSSGRLQYPKLFHTGGSA